MSEEIGLPTERQPLLQHSLLGGSLGLGVKGGESQSEVHEFESLVYWLKEETQNHKVMV